MKIRLLLLPTLSAVVALLLAGCASDPDTPIRETSGPPVVSGPLTVTPIRFQTTDYFFRPTVIDAEEGRLEVPERHGDPEGRKITVRYVRFPALTDTPTAPIVYLAGGPGGSGTWSSSGDRYPLFQRLREVADVIAYDQRGTWGTEPYMICPGSWDYPLDQPADEATLSSAVKPFLETCWQHFADQADLSAYNTVESAEDLDALRRALGAEKLNLWGISYGTHLGLAYLRAHPDRVERAILAGVEGPNHTYKLPERVDSVLARVAAMVAADSQAQRAAPNFLDDLKTLLARLEAEPARIAVEHPRTGETHSVVVGASDLRRAVFGSLGEREDIEEILERGIPILKGDLTELGLFALSNRTANRELVMSLSMDCASGATADRMAEIRKQEKNAILGNPSTWLHAACAHWPVQDLGDTFRSDVQSDVPTLFISGTLDAKTPPKNAEDVLPGFSRGHHLIIENGSHDDDLFLSSPEIAEAMETFLRGGEPAERVVLDPIRFKLP